jgi:precorrin-8X/cobalt-precorrin-8 methylmutase
VTQPTHPIEARSYRIMEAELGRVLAAWPEPERSVVARMVHATADGSFAATARLGPDAVRAAVAALRRGAPVVCDSRMVAAGISAPGVRCYLDRVSAVPAGGATRSAAAIELAAREHPDGALWVVGNAPTALDRLIDLHAAGVVGPAAVVGLPVGYVGAAEAKDRLWSSALAARAVTNRGRRGGSPVAAGAVNALWRLVGAAGDPARPPSPPG